MHAWSAKPIAIYWPGVPLFASAYSEYRELCCCVVSCASVAFSHAFSNVLVFSLFTVFSLAYF